MTSPVGTWTARVRRPSETTVCTFHFTPSGRVFLDAGGAGTWRSTGPGRFSYRVAEPILAEDGSYRGWVDITQHAVLHDGAFTSDGTTPVHAVDGGVVYRARVSVTALAYLAV